MKALSLWQPWASLIAVGHKTIETRSWTTSYRGPLAITATKRAPLYAERVGDIYCYPLGDYERGGRPSSLPWEARRLGCITPEGERDPDCYAKGLAFPLPFGAVVATCRLVEVVPVVDRCGTDMRAPAHLCRSGDTLLLHRPVDHPFPDGETERDVSDQLPFGGFSPGRFAWLLDDIAPTTERCPWCWGARKIESTVPGVPAEVCRKFTPCPVCWPCDEGKRLTWDDGRAGTCDPVPARGKQGIWEWTP